MFACYRCGQKSKLSEVTFSFKNVLAMFYEPVKQLVERPALTFDVIQFK